MLKLMKAGLLRQLLIIPVLFLFIACGGSLDKDTGSSGSSGTTPTPTTPAARVDLLVSSPQMGSDGSSSVTVTALVKSSTNVALKDKKVTFSANSGTLIIENDTTDKNGIAKATLNAAGDKTNRIITMSAQSDSVVSSTTVDVIGTTVLISGVNSLVSGAVSSFTLFLKDSAGGAITNQNINLSSSLGNSFSANPVRTNSSGQAQVSYTATKGGNETITASSMGATTTQSVSISTTDFTFISPTVGSEINIGAIQTVTVRYTVGGTPPPVGTVINFATTRGTIAATGATDAGGNASAVLSSTTAGRADISATVAAGGGSIQTTVLFVAINAAFLNLQPNPAVISTNVSGSTIEQSAITAVVRDPNGNLVKNKTVRFSLTDVSGGHLTLANAVTDSLGMASTVYVSSSSPSDKDKVIVTATVDGSAATATTTLTVSRKQIYVVFGTGNTIENYSTTQYRLPYTALVTDVTGNPVPGVTVTATLTPVEYYKGFTFGCVSTGDIYWQTDYSVAASGSRLACANEDNNSAVHTLYPLWRLNGILNSDAVSGITEDANGDGVLSPGNIATITTTATTGADGFAQFYVTYAKMFARWVKVRIDGYIYSYGDQSMGRTEFELSIASPDMKCEASVPGPVSPWGRGVFPNNVCANKN